MPAAENDGRDNVVADSQTLDARSHRLNDAGTVMTGAHPQMRQRNVVRGEVVIGMAQPCGRHPDEDLTPPRGIELNFSNISGTWLFPQQRGAATHGIPFCDRIQSPTPAKQGRAR
jgi:hypothetical protein